MIRQMRPSHFSTSLSESDRRMPVTSTSGLRVRRVRTYRLGTTMNILALSNHEDSPLETRDDQNRPKRPCVSLKLFSFLFFFFFSLIYHLCFYSAGRVFGGRTSPNDAKRVVWALGKFLFHIFRVFIWFILGSVYVFNIAQKKVFWGAAMTRTSPNDAKTRRLGPR